MDKIHYLLDILAPHRLRIGPRLVSLLEVGENRQLLRLLGLPVFSDSCGLAHQMGVSEKQIRLFNRYAHAGHYYKEYSIQKSSGGTRVIRQPGWRLKGVQAWILRNILDRLTPSPHATGFRKGLSLVSNVIPHSGNRYFICLDIEDFFPSIKFWQICQIFRLIGYSEKASRTIANLCTCKNSLPQGGVTSPSLSNLVTSKLDRRLVGYTAGRNIAYTRYADDMTFSSNNPRALARALPILRKIIHTSGFQINERKSRTFGPRCRCLITGLVKNNSHPKFGIGRRKKREMRAIMHNLILKGTSDQQYQTEASILGWLSFLQSVDSESYGQMRVYYDGLKKKASASNHD